MIDLWTRLHTARQDKSGKHHHRLNLGTYEVVVAPPPKEGEKVLSVYSGYVCSAQQQTRPVSVFFYILNPPLPPPPPPPARLPLPLLSSLSPLAGRA